MNSAYRALLPDLKQVSPAERNVLWLLFTNPAVRHLFLDWDREAEQLAGQFRGRLGRHPHDERGPRLAAALTGASPRFARLWAGHAVAEFSSGLKQLDHPVVGRLDLEYVKTDVAGDDQQLIVLLPADEAAAAKLKDLAHSRRAPPRF